MFDVAIIGCGVIGASLAYTLSQYRLRVLVLEKENDVAMGTTKANSAIVHAGYDPAHGTLMAQLNVRGSEMMEALCQRLSVKYARIGSFVLAFDEAQRAQLERMLENGRRNGVPGLELLDSETAHRMEPDLADEVCAALYAPSAAVIDPWGLCIAEAEVAVRNGVTLALRTAVTGLTDAGDHVRLHTTAGDYDSRLVVNCAGGWGHEICAMTGQDEWQAYPSRGEYYLLDKSSGDLVSHVIFQCPTAAGKGILVAPTVHGNLIVGPNAVDVDDPLCRETTQAGLEQVAAIGRKSVPGIDLRQSIRNFAGVRANTSEDDFIIRPAAALPRLLHVAGIKSPGLSAAPAIAVYATQLLADMGLPLEKKPDWDGTRTQICFKELSEAEKTALVARDPRYGRVICRCETITEGEIVAAIHSPIPPCSVDGIKRRAGAGMGRCQGGFCGPRVLDILARERGVSPLTIGQDGDGTYILAGRTKEGAQA
ncbi:MAG: NAD(P)/FAD-dependent oxidoreductase [Eubacteriales bacterium]|nr:NAD(P)/FAD-dependent oxidoreductase [Eubacteriales bacterium]